MTQHTPGPLHLITSHNAGPDGEPYWYLDCEDGARKGMRLSNATTIVDPECGILTRADVQRLMDCWNACAGIPPEAVKDLRSVLTNALEWWGVGRPSPTWVVEARALLVKAKLP